MLKMFLLIPFITLEVAAILGLIYFTVFINQEIGLLIGFIALITISCFLVLVYAKDDKGQDNA